MAARVADGLGEGAGGGEGGELRVEEGGDLLQVGHRVDGAWP